MSVIRFDRGRSVGASNGAVRFGDARGHGGPPTGFAWVIHNGQYVTFTGTYNGVSYTNEPVYARIV